MPHHPVFVLSSCLLSCHPVFCLVIPFLVSSFHHCEVYFAPTCLPVSLLAIANISLSIILHHLYHSIQVTRVRRCLAIDIQLGSTLHWQTYLVLCSAAQPWMNLLGFSLCCCVSISMQLILALVTDNYSSR